MSERQEVPAIRGEAEGFEPLRQRPSSGLGPAANQPGPLQAEFYRHDRRWSHRSVSRLGPGLAGLAFSGEAKGEGAVPSCRW
jgi:hypothetical protein